MKAFYLFMVICLAVCELQAQLPSSELYAFEIRREKDSIKFEKAIYLSGDNRGGYNNHPYFVDNDRLLISQAARGEQADIYLLDLRDNRKTQLTRTPHGEFSPKQVPTFYGARTFSLVRQEFYPEDTLLRIWQFPENLSDNGSVVLPEMTTIGYYEWVNSRELLVFSVEPGGNKLYRVNLSGQKELVANNPGRCFHPDGVVGAFYYVQKDNNGSTLMYHRPSSYGQQGGEEKVAPTLPGSEDFIILPDRSLLMGNGSILYHLIPGKDRDWRPIADLRSYNIRNISRLALSPRQNRLILVNSR